MEVNTNPALFTNVGNLEKSIKPVVYDTLDLILDLHQYGMNKENIDLHNKRFDVLFDEKNILTYKKWFIYYI